MNTLLNNPILDTDSYKASHWLQYPAGTTKVYSYIESRGGKYASTLFFGLQVILKKLETRITQDMVNEAALFFAAHGLPFNRAGWELIVNKHQGKLPIRIKAVPEGVVVPTHNVLMTVENTDPECFWLTSWLETQILRVWYPITVATQSFTIKKIIKQHLDRTSDDPDSEIAFKLHDFGSRGVSSEESAAIGGAAHLVNFMGSDTVAGVMLANRVYKSEMAGFSIPASEHSSITTWGREGEVGAYRNMIKQFGKPGALVACVSDSYDLYNAVENLWGKELKQEVINSGAILVVRPDSGDPAEVVLKTAKLLDKTFGSSLNNKGFKVLNNVRIIQGDGINEDSIRQILFNLEQNNFSATNIAFGMGGALLQQVNRDTQRFAYKCSHAMIDGKSVDVFKDPVTDIGKRSKKGRLDLVHLQGKLQTVSGEQNFGSVMKTVFENGVITKEYTLAQIRKNSNEVF